MELSQETIEYNLKKKFMKFLTQLNSGCVDMCKNMLKSAENVGIGSENFIIACLDANAYEQMKQYPNAFLYKDQQYTGYQDWSFDKGSNFRQIVKLKWKLISDTHNKHKRLCWVDTDIVFKQNPKDFFDANSKFVLFQTDVPGSLICSGLMVFNDTKECCNMIEECGLNETEDDQILINQIALTKYSTAVALLPMEYFPNGHLYYTIGMKDKALMVHNNHMVGIETKINKFKQEGMWYV